MNTQNIADRLVELCKAGQFVQAQDELYADDCVSIEAGGAPEAQTKGKAAIKAKLAQWEKSVDQVHGIEVSDPLVIDNHFTIKHGMDCTFKERGRQKFDELSVYEVKNGKVIKEQFFYTMGS